MTQQKKVFEEQLLKGIKTQKKESCWKSVRSKNDEDLNEVLREGKAIAQKKMHFLPVFVVEEVGKTPMLESLSTAI